MRLALIGFAACGWAATARRTDAQGPSAVDHRTIQAALDANPGAMVWVPAGDHVITEKLRIHADGSGLHGPGRIVQANPAAPIVEVEHAADVCIRDVTLARAAGKTDTESEAILAVDCRGIRISGVKVVDNRTRTAAIELRHCPGGSVRDCSVRNYMRVSVDDRTHDADWGYAFRCIDGSGVVVRGGRGVRVEGNRIVEDDLLPTPETRRKHNLGEFIRKNPVKGAIVSQATWDSGRVDNWHQGSAVVITEPETSDVIQVLGNSIENAAQGIDIHADHVVVANNVVDNAFIGMKAMHGSRHVLITGNQFLRNDLWAIGLMPGVASHAASAARPGAGPREANVDGGSVIAGNIISEFGRGHAHWVWGDDRAPLKFDSGQKRENPPLTDVIVQGNMIYDSGRDGELVDGKPVVPRPRYAYAVQVAAEVRGLHFLGNLFHPGTRGVSNVELRP